MNLNKLRLFAMAARQMDWLSQRQRVLAQNIANADTPGYQARDLKPLDFKMLADRAAQRIGPSVTHTAHLTSNRAPDTAVSKRNSGKSEESLSGNTVELESEIGKAAETAMEHQQTASLYRKHLELLRAAIGRSF
jgi:flagellar basal-body rod protein FlgB